MRVAGTTMGTPDRSVKEAVNLFAGLGFGGMEIVCRGDHPVQNLP